jgi:hypothetical protein
MLVVEAPGPALAQSDPNGAPSLPGELPMGAGGTMPGQAMVGSNQERIDAAVKKLREGQSDQEKQAARQSLRTILEGIFDDDMEAREKQAQEIEDRLAKLRQQYRTRERAKDEIIELQLQVLENDAAGLGFPAAQPAPRSSGYDPFGGTIPPAWPKRKGPALQDYVLEAFKKRNAAAILDMNKRGHFIESPDGKLYAYANVNFPHGPSHIFVRDCATGELVADGMARTPVGPLQFTDEGVASREAGDRLELRVPLSNAATGDGAAIRR